MGGGWRFWVVSLGSWVCVVGQFGHQYLPPNILGVVASQIGAFPPVPRQLKKRRELSTQVIVIKLQHLHTVSKMQPSVLSWSLLALLASGAQAVLFSYAACAGACAGTVAGWESFCGSTTPAAIAAGIPWFTPICFSAALAFATPAGQAACQGVCNLLLPC